MLPATARDASVDRADSAPTIADVEAVPLCGAPACGLDRAPSVSDAGMDFIKCPTCGVLRIPPANLIHSRVLPDPVGKLSPIMRILMSMRMLWLGQELPALHEKHAAIADIGCGDGQFLEFLTSKGYDQAFGIEPDEIRVRNAQIRGVPVFATREAAEAGGFLQKGMDIIFVWHVLEHIDRPADFIAVYSKLLAPAGRLVISVPNQASVQTRLFGYFSAYPDYGRHVWYHEAGYLEWFTKNAPGYTAERMRDRNYEYEIFSWVDSIASAITRQQNFIHKAIKKGEGSVFRKAAATLAALGLLPIAALLAPFSLYSGRGSTLTFVLHRNS